jgi:N-acyl-D-aspartate/D-glutamate deacylase
MIDRRRHPRTSFGRLLRGSAFLLATPVLLAGCSREPCGRLLGAPEYDLLVRGGTIVDGTGGPARAGDVLVCGDLVARVGPVGAVRARHTIDASGLVVAPGFVDMLGQSEYVLLLDGNALSKITQGITSELTGEVTSVVPVNGNTLASLTPAQRRLTTWNDLDGYFDALERSGTAINLGTYVTLGSVRTAVLGSATRAPTPVEMERMKGMVEEAMQQGALGLSTGLGYPPASSATTAEIVGLAEVAAAHGGGYASHIRSEGDSLVESVREAIRVGELAGMPVHIHHLKAAGHRNWGKMREAIAAIEEARARGV